VGDCAPNQSAAGLSAGAVAPERRVFDPPPVACRHGQLARRARPEQRPMRSGRWCVALCRLPPPATVACQQNRPWGGLGGPVSLPKPLESQATSKRRNGGAAQKCAWRGVGQEKICIGDCRRGGDLPTECRQQHQIRETNALCAVRALWLFTEVYQGGRVCAQRSSRPVGRSSPAVPLVWWRKQAVNK